MKDCLICQGNGWVETPNGARRCECFVDQRSDTPKTPIDGRSLALATRALSAIGYFPRDHEAQTIIGDALAAMCPNVEALRYVVRRACELYQHWDRCGLQGLRQIVCFRYRPADGIEIYGTAAYPGGLPVDAKESTLTLPAAVPQLAIEGEVVEGVSADARFDRKIRLLAHAKDIRRRTKKTGEAPTNPNYRPIGDIEIQRAVDELHDQRARRELFGEENA